jgi:hypothetical protein
LNGGQNNRKLSMHLKIYHIQKLPTLASPPDQPLILYVSATHTLVSGTLVEEREIYKEGRKLSHQVPIYFISEALVGSKKYYSEMEKICYCCSFECEEASILLLRTFPVGHRGSSFIFRSR